jgi:hypothetical protein
LAVVVDCGRWRDRGLDDVGFAEAGAVGDEGVGLVLGEDRVYVQAAAEDVGAACVEVGDLGQVADGRQFVEVADCM